MKLLTKIWESITLPLVSIAVMIDESKRINEDGSWNEYHAKRNEKKMCRDERKKANQKRYVFPKVNKI